MSKKQGAISTKTGWVLCVMLGALLALAPHASSAGPVSPGHEGRFTRINTAWPTFNWAADPGAKAPGQHAWAVRPALDQGLGE